ncbi:MULTISPECIES: ferredoxin [Streptomyces]|uniref:ferredoxin n=1 Tax=Streptomyces TaxID=1883 RepID=UPI001670ABDB|nr:MULTISPECIES: ferredoxin [Streptomyces]UFR00251.1 ferredoxin [Streptomyces sp. Go40/10]GGS80987.1 ferredoxin [Streptomyces cinerochromogenes]
MTTTRLHADRERCIGAGMCALTAPEVFDQDAEDGRVLLLNPEPPAAQRAAVRMAAGVCPSGAITLHEREPGGS